MKTHQEPATSGARARNRIAHSATRSPSGTATSQRKAACACGGGCPHCREEAWQAKLAVSQPGDASEHEADRIAAEVMRGPDTPPARRSAARSEQSPSGTPTTATVVPESVHDVVRSAGEPL